MAASRVSHLSDARQVATAINTALARTELASLTNAANDAAAATAGVPIASLYRNGSVLMIRVS